ncbi:DNA replication complex GINS protein SLD5 [Microtus ochrogaster]|uniref:DNA replication complex GINS protein SLD5 n=1 Tax=Microtus ochrogaster TaxID=79684 RepID=A0A8J6GA64_MICOH|nr:DNA replication complex GINS protein SLD5 [Microtus ochrogaster]
MQRRSNRFSQTEAGGCPGRPPGGTARSPHCVRADVIPVDAEFGLEARDLHPRRPGPGEAVRSIVSSGAPVRSPPPVEGLPAVPRQRVGWKGRKDEFPLRVAALSDCCEVPGSETMTEELDLHGQDSDGGSEEVVLTPAELIERLEQEDNLRRAQRGDLKVSIHRMEMERIRYVLSSYLRCRLMKIEKFFPHILEKEKMRSGGEPSILSPEEFIFVKEYMDHTETHLRNVALKHMPPNLQKVDLLRAVPKPDLDSYVFLRVKERQENILVEPEADEQRDYVIDLEEGSQHLIRYKTIAPLVASGAVQLI